MIFNESSNQLACTDDRHSQLALLAIQGRHVVRELQL